MSDERFDYELRSVLREIAGREAPMSLRNRVADVIDRAPVSRRLWFAPPMKLSLAAVVAVAVLALAVLFVGSQMVGPAPSQTPGPSASASASSVEPTPSASSEPTAVPTPIPTPGVAAWTGLDWAVGAVDEGKWLQFNDVLPWRGGYVGVGSSRAPAGDPPTSLIWQAFFTSADGLHWAIAQEGAAISYDDYQEPEDALPAHVVPVGDRLLAVGRTQFGGGAPMLWSTEDGSTWTLLDNSSWKDALTGNTLLSVAAGPGGVVVVGAEGTMCCANPQGPPLIIHSADGVTWDRLELTSVFENAYPRDVTAYAGGFAIVGRVGEQQVMDPIPAFGVPAAWTSPDGVTWLAAEVEGAEAEGAFLYAVIAGSDGLFATGRQGDSSSGGEQPLSGWASTDGRSWQLLGEMGTDLPLATGNPAMVVGDGAHMVIFGRKSCKTTELSAWTALDGVTWTQLAFSGETSYLPTISGPICNDDGTEGSTAGSVGISYAAVMPNGVFVVTSSSAPASPGYWFLTATTQ
jgi:hypothetical protein